VQTNVSCSGAGTFNLAPPTSAAPLNWTITASLPDHGPGCTASQSIDSTAAASQYGVEPVPGCVPQSAGGAPPDKPFAPVLFWFFNSPQNSGTPVASVVFCSPSIVAYNVVAAVDGATGLLDSVNATGRVDISSNNVTGGGFAGKAFNGVSFDTTDFNLTDSFVRARALAVQSGIPGAIFRLASDPAQGGGLNTVFANSTGFLALTEKIYTQYLSVVALSNYFVAMDAPVAARITLWPNRLWINGKSAHMLTAILILVAISGTAVHIIHRRQRKRLYLASRPGSMAHYMSLLSHPEFAALLANKGDANLGSVAPLDSARTMRRKLEGVRFMLDEHTGGLVPVLPGESSVTARHRDSRRASGASGLAYELEDPRKALLSPGYKVEPYTDPFDRKDSGPSSGPL